MSSNVVPFVRRVSEPAQQTPVKDEFYFEMPAGPDERIALARDVYRANFALLTMTCSIVEASIASSIMTDRRWPGRLLFNADLPSRDGVVGLRGLFQVHPVTKALERLRAEPLRKAAG